MENFYKRVGNYRMTVIERSYETYEGVSKGKESMIYNLETLKIELIEGFDLSYDFEKCKRDEDVLELVEKYNNR